MPETRPYIERSRQAFRDLAEEQGFAATAVTVRVSRLSSEEAIGSPSRRDFPLLKGKEHLVEAVMEGARGHAFTDSPQGFTGSVEDLLAMPLNRNHERGLYLAALNAAFRHAGRVNGTVHCRNDDPERCARQIAERVEGHLGWQRVGLIGFNPAIAEGLARRLGPERLRLTDLDPDNIGTERFGVPVWDGENRAEELIRWADGVLLTGTTFANGTFDPLWEVIEATRTPGVIFGVTAAAMAHLFGFERLCPFARG